MSTTARFPLATAPNQDNTGRILTGEYQAPVYAASLALKLSAAKTVVAVAQLTGALSITAEVTRPQIGDELVILLNTDATQRIVTLSTGIAASGTITIPASKRASFTATFDGAAWVETGRAIQA